MRYCLVFSPTNKQIDFACKRDLVDWIKSHSPFFSEFNCRRWFVHRAGKPKFVYSFYVRLERLCSLKEYIVKHKL